jgi:hypothetical protein
MSTTATLRHFPDDPEAPGIAELQFPTIYSSDVRRSVAVSATPRDGVLVLTNFAPNLSADAARQLAAQLVEAAAWVDGEAAQR